MNRQIRRILLGTPLLAALLAVAVASGADATSERRSASCPSSLAGKTDLGRVAYIDGTRLRVVQLAGCKVRTLVRHGARPPLRWSADGRYLAYGDGDVVSAAGGAPTHPLGRLKVGWGSGSAAWVWSPSGHELAGATSRGGVVIGGPGAHPRQLWRSGWGATSIAWTPAGSTLAVSRSLYSKGARPYRQEIWLLHLRTGRRTLLWHQKPDDLAPPWLSGFSPNGRWLLAWEDSQNSASLAADGVPLTLVQTHGGRSVSLGPELMYGDFVSWCGGSALTYVKDRGGREVSQGDRVTVTGPPRWPTTSPAETGAARNLSYISPVCDPQAGEPMVVAAAGPSSPDLPTGHEHRRIFAIRLGGDWAPLERPAPHGFSDELPMPSSDHRWIAFIRTNERTGTGRLYLLELGTRPGGRPRRIGPIADLGQTDDYYGHYGWASQIAWYSR